MSRAGRASPDAVERHRGRTRAARRRDVDRCGLSSAGAQIVERDVNMIRGAGSNPGLVVVVATDVVVDRRAESAVGHGHRIGVDRIADEWRHQDRRSVGFPCNRFVIVVERAEARPGGAPVGRDEKWVRVETGGKHAEASGEHLHRVHWIDGDARLGILVGLDAVVVRNDIDDAEYEWKIGTSGRRHGTTSFAVPGFYTVRALASMIPARLTSANSAATRRGA